MIFTKEVISRFLLIAVLIFILADMAPHPVLNPGLISSIISRKQPKLSP